MIPQFPKFKKLARSDRHHVERLTAPYLPYSDFNFTSLWAYNNFDNVKISVLHGNLIVILSDYITGESSISCIGTTKPHSTIKCLLNYAKISHTTEQLTCVPEVFVKSNRTVNKKFKLKEDVDNNDYILRFDDYIKLKGRKFASKKKAIASFKKSHPHYSVRALDLSKKENHVLILHMFHTWEKTLGKIKHQTERERAALNRLLHYAKYATIDCFSVWNENDMLGFIIVEKDTHKYVQGHFIKFNRRVKGVSEILFVHVSHVMRKQGYRYFNIQQDMGQVGLRNAKILSRPYRMLNKFIIQHPQS